MVVETPQTAPQSLPVKPRRAGKLTLTDAAAIADKVAKKRLTESEACYLLGIEPKHWFVWKSRHKHSATFEAICARVRAASIENAVDRIEKAGEDMIIEREGEKPFVRRGDWRADHARLSLIAPERFADKPQNVTTNQVLVLPEAESQRLLATIYGASKAIADKPIDVEVLPIKSS